MGIEERIFTEIQNLEEIGGPDTIGEYIEVLVRVQDEVETRLKNAYIIAAVDDPKKEALRNGLYRALEAILLNKDGAIADTVWMPGMKSETLVDHLQGLLVELGENVDDVLTFCEELVESEMVK